MTTLPATKYLTPTEIAARFKVGERVVRGWMKSGQLAAVNFTENPKSKKPRRRSTVEAVEQFELTRIAISQGPIKPPARRPRSKYRKLV